jgi:serine/threonine protein phosphatase PrpC
MTWRIVQASSVGTSHIEHGEVCQDECLAVTFCAPDREEYFLGIVSDGAGSASHGRFGAEVACARGIDVIEQWVRQEASLSKLTWRTVTSWIVDIRQHICHAAETKGLTPRDVACTLLGAIVGTKAAAFFQVGDGAIVIGVGDSFHPVFWPDAGEYANMTHFITDENALEHLRRKIWVSSLETSLPDEVAMFSDGLQRLALVYESLTAYKPFFAPMFHTLRKANLAACDMLSDQLAHFLSSSKINERTDDDKTLVLATRRHESEE